MSERPKDEAQHAFCASNGLPNAKEYTSNDAGRAERFVDRHGARVRFVPKWGRWLVWQEHHWRPDEDGAVTRLALEHHRELLRAASFIADDKKRREAVDEAMQLGDGNAIRKMTEIARVDSRIVAPHYQLDADPFLLGVRNGVVDLRTGEGRPGRPEDLITKQAGTDFAEAAGCPRWIAFLDRVLAHNRDLITYVQALVGYTLTGDISEQAFAFLWGSGKNGKSVFTMTLEALLGDYAQRAPQSLLTANNNGREPTHEIARLQGARLVIGSETEEGARLAESRIKDLTGGDTLTGRFLYQEPFDFRPCLKLWLFGNHKPEIRGTDDGIWRRVRLIPFTVQIPEEERDPHLAEALREELPGILRWALEGTRQWLAGGLVTPGIVLAASDEYRQDEDTLADFISEEVGRQEGAKTSAADLFARYEAWAARNGMRYPLSSRTLSRRLKDRGYRSFRGREGYYWEGVELR